MQAQVVSELIIDYRYAMSEEPRLEEVISAQGTM